MISFLRRLFGKRLVHGDGARRGVAGDFLGIPIVVSDSIGPGVIAFVSNPADPNCRITRLTGFAIDETVNTPRTTIEDIESACGGPMLPDDRPAA